MLVTSPLLIKKSKCSCRLTSSWLTLVTTSSLGLPLLESVLHLVALKCGSAETEEVLPVDYTLTIKSVRAY